MKTHSGDDAEKSATATASTRPASAGFNTDKAFNLNGNETGAAAVVAKQFYFIHYVPSSKATPKTDKNYELETLQRKVAQLFSETQIRKMRNPSKRLKWSPEDISNEIAIHAAVDHERIDCS